MCGWQRQSKCWVFYLEIAMMLHEKVYILEEEERRWAQHLIYTTKQI